MAKKKDEKAEPWQIGGAAIGTALGALLGFLTSLFFSSNITAWLKEHGLKERYKYLIGTFIILIVYGLLDEHHRYSRFLTFGFGAVGTYRAFWDQIFVQLNPPIDTGD